MFVWKDAQTSPREGDRAPVAGLAQLTGSTAQSHHGELTVRRRPPLADDHIRVIKRYANRKLYDPQSSQYVTHDDIAQMVRDGESVCIIDNRTKEDLTRMTLAQILFKEEKSHRETVPLQTLRNIIQSGGEFIQKRISQPVSNLREEAEATVRNVRSSILPRAETTTVSDGEGLSENDTEMTAAGPLAPDSVREWLDNKQQAYENLQGALEDRWDLAANALRHLDDNRKRLAALERRVKELETLLRDRDKEGEDS